MTRLAKPKECAECPLYGDGLGFSNSEGHGTTNVTIVGEALGQNEEQDALPFRPQAQAGSLLERAFKRCGYSRDQFRITNVVRCRPPRDYLAGAPYEFEAIRHCRPYLDHEIATGHPKVILAAGGTAARELTGMSGEKQGVSHIRGYVIPARDTAIPVIPTFHPSFIRQGKAQFFGVLCHDLMRAVQYAKQGIPTPMPTRYQLTPSLDDALSFLGEVEGNPALHLTYDIETPTSAAADEDERDEDKDPTIVQIQFSLHPGEGIVFPWRDPYIDVAKRILACGNRKFGFYSHLFDDPRLRAVGCVFGGPYPEDLYEMWHAMQPDLPANLQFVASFYGMDVAGPWKHLATANSAYYGACDVDAPQRILAALPDQLRKRGLYDGYFGLVYKVRPILEKMEKRGVPINDGRRRAFGLELDQAAHEVDVEMQAMVPDDLKNIHPKQGYKREPKDTTGMIVRQFEDASEMMADGSGVEIVTRYCRLEPFKPSPKQLLKYIRAKGHPVPRNLKEDRDTTVAKELERLARKTGDRLYLRVIHYRELRTMKGTFVDGWAPGADGRVHTTFTFAPATGQLSSRDPNVQNAPEHEHEGRETGLADKFQQVIEAPPGHKIVSFDHKSFHALTLAFLAQDADYERVVRLDIHSFLASQFLRLKPASTLLAMKDDELRDFLAWVKREHRLLRDVKAKRTILRWGFGSGYRSIYQDNMESFTGEAEAKKMVRTLEDCFPKTVKCRRAMQQKAHYDTFLISPFGFIRWFWDVFSYDPKSGRIRSGDQAEQAIAFLPANCAFGMMRMEAKEFDRRGLDERFGLINTIHDSYKFCCPDRFVEECLYTVKGIMEEPCPILVDAAHPLGLSCAVTASVGQNNAAKSESNPDGREEVILAATQPALSN